MTLIQYQVDAFTQSLFRGNPAAVVILKEWLPTELMQSIAAENNLAETAFVCEQESRRQIRWFTPAVEVDLCGHATLAAAFVLFDQHALDGQQIDFDSASGVLSVHRTDEMLVLDFPRENVDSIPEPDGLAAALGAPIKAAYHNIDLLIELESEQAVRDLMPDFRALMNYDARGIIVTAPGKQVDFVNRFFGPKVGIDEDPVTGSAFTKLIPHWADRLGKTSLTAQQVSARGGQLDCKLVGDRVHIGGHATLFSKAELYLD